MNDEPTRRYQFSIRTLLVLTAISAVAALGIPIVLLVLLYVAFFAYLIYSSYQLPDRVASHFNFRGQPDTWWSRRFQLAFIAVLGIIGPLGMPTIFLLSSKIHPKMVQLSLWFACLLLGVVFAAHSRVVQANRRTPVVLLPAWDVLAMYALGVIVWFVMFLRLVTP